MREGEPGRGTVLFVGSSPGSRAAVTDVGFDVEDAPGTGAALDRLDLGGVDCVVTDHDPPEVDGVALAERLAERRSELPVVFHPTDGSESLASRAVAAGVSAYVPGDEGPETLVSAVERAPGSNRGPSGGSDRRERERALETLHAAAARIGGCETVEAACEATVEAAGRALDFETCTVLVAEREWLVPKAVSAGVPEDGARRMRTDQGLAGRTLRTGESHLVEEIAEEPAADPADEGYRSGISVPVGGTGVFQAVASEPEAFDGPDVEMAELLVAHTARTLDRLRHEAELERQNERLEGFAGVVSHDLRNPLNVAQARLELAREERDGESANLEAVAGALSRMDVIVDDTLTLARQGRAAIETEPVELATFARRCWGLLDTGRADLETGDSLVVRADPNHLRSLFENLFRNAVEHGSTSPPSQAREDSVEHGSTGSRTQSGDTVEHGSTGYRVGSDDPDGRGDATPTVRVGAIDREGFYVEDDGPGIPESERERVFEAGYTTASAGTGFGLAIVEEIVEAQGWEVAVASSGDGGARFEVTGVEPAD